MVFTAESPVLLRDPTQDPRNRPYRPYGSALDVFYGRDDQIIDVGPSGTGKSRAILEKIHFCLSKYPGSRALMVRKTRASLTQTAMVTFEKFVIPMNDSVHWRTGEQEFRYNNGSVFVVGGMDKAIKIMSSEYDMIYAQEATELSEDDWETLTIRCRFGNMPFNQTLGDCNPGPPTHWIKQKIDKELIRGINSRHEDNPVYWDQELNTWTEKGLAYIQKLDALTGVRYKRYRLGIWAAAEGMIYTEWNPEIHMVPRFPIPADWRRYWVIDFGYVHPFVWQAWAVDPAGHAYRFAEIHKTGILVEDAVDEIKRWMRENSEFMPDNIICDHDAEDRATFERHMNVQVRPAVKAVVNGIHSVKQRLRLAPDGKPNLMFMYDSLLEVDPVLQEAMRPTCSEQEFDSYEWLDKDNKEVPRKEDDDGMDCTRYLSVHLDRVTEAWTRGMAR